MEPLLSEIRFALRSLRRSPGATAVVVTCLALGIAVSATVFGVVDTLILRAPPHVADPERLVRLASAFSFPGAGEVSSSSFSYALGREFAAVDAFEALAAFGEREVSIGEAQHRVSARALVASSDYFGVLGVPPALGRFFAMDPFGAEPVVHEAVLSHGFWSRWAGADPAVLGRHLAIGRHRFTIVGVAPRHFNGIDARAPDLWLSLGGAGELLAPTWAEPGTQVLRLIARLRPQASAAQAALEATALFQAQHQGHPLLADARITTDPLLPVAGLGELQVRVSLWIAALSTIVLLIAAANVSNLLLLQALRRRVQHAVRSALGASRWQLGRQVGLEVLLLSLAGAGVALGVIAAAGGLVRETLLGELATVRPGLDGRFLAMTLALTAVVAGLCSILPAWRVAQGNLHDLLQQGASRSGALRSRVRNAFVGAQVALALLLLLGAGLFLRSLEKALDLDLGIEPRGVLVGTLDFQGTSYETPEVDRIYGEVLDRVRRFGGVEAAALGAGIPFESLSGSPIRAFGQDDPPALPGGGPYLDAVSPAYFETLGIRLREGRVFSQEPGARRRPSALVNETAARLLWPGGEALGECLEIDDAGIETCWTVVGVVEDTARQTLRDAPAAQVYIPLDLAPEWMGSRALFVRSASSPGPLLEVIRSEMSTAARALPHVSVRELVDYLEPQYRAWHLGSVMLSLFAILGLVLAVVGISAVTAFGVAQRKRELGIRLALGAGRGRVIRSVVSSALGAAGAGALVGLAAGLVAAPRLRPLLFETSPFDPVVIASGIVVVLGVTALASWLPARKAAEIDPAEVIRLEL